MIPDPYYLQRFIEGQKSNYAAALQELRAGEKRTHWMWYIFPQIAGLGGSPMSRLYAISGRAGARAYWEHPVLGARLRECTEAVLKLEGRTVEQIFGYPDHVKFRSCMTLFEAATEDAAIFRAALLKYCDGEPDQRTLDILKGQRGQLTPKI